jgi:hypothetical protein
MLMIEMRIYLDICCIKRPWDDQTQPRVAAETVAVLSVMKAAAAGSHTCLRSPAHDFENSLNPDPRRAAAVAEWLAALPQPDPASEAVDSMFQIFRAAGVKQMDAYHLAWAMHGAADVLVTCDDRFLSQANRLVSSPPPRIMDPLAFVREIRL